ESGAAEASTHHCGAESGAAETSTHYSAAESGAAEATAAKAAPHPRSVKAAAVEASAVEAAAHPAHAGLRLRGRSHRRDESDGGQRDYDLTHHGVSSFCRKHRLPPRIARRRCISPVAIVAASAARLGRDSAEHGTTLKAVLHRLSGSDLRW